MFCYDRGAIAEFSRPFTGRTSRCTLYAVMRAATAAHDLIVEDYPSACSAAAAGVGVYSNGEYSWRRGFPTQDQISRVPIWAGAANGFTFIVTTV